MTLFDENTSPLEELIKGEPQAATTETSPNKETRSDLNTSQISFTGIKQSLVCGSVVNFNVFDYVRLRTPRFTGMLGGREIG